MPDMLVKLYDLPDEAPALARSRAFGVEIRRAMPPDRERVLRWVGEHSGECAAGECAVAFAHTPCGCWIATRGAEIVGYACYDATAPDFFGPTRVLDREQGHGVGTALLLRCLTAMREHPQVFVRCSSEFPYYPAAQQLFRWYQEGFFGRVIEARFTIKHASDMDLSKPINWKRQLKTNGAYGCMGDLGIHTQHLPFRLGFRVDSVSAQLANLVPQRPCGDGFAPCETYDNAILLCGAHNAAGDRFPMVMEMKRMAPGCTNTVEYEIYGLDGSAKFSTEDVNTVWYTRNQGREQAWSRLILGQRTLFPVITGGIFEFGFSDAMLQMFAAFIAELCGEPCAFGCFRPDEALLSHQLLTGALRAYETGSVVRLD